MFIIALIFCLGWSKSSTLTATFDFASLGNLSVTLETNSSSGHNSWFLNKNSGPSHYNLLLTIEFDRHTLAAISAGLSEDEI